MQTIERPTASEANGRARPPWTPVAIAVLATATVAILILAIFNKWAVLALVILAAVAGLGIWTWNRGFVFIEIVGFLIHFDGLEFGMISSGRILAGVATIILVHKVVVQRWRPPAVPWRTWLPIWLLTSWAILSATWSSETTGWIKTFLMFYLAVVFFCITSMLVESHKDLLRFLRAFWVGGLFGSGAGILALFLGTRSVGFGGDPNYFGLLEAAMIPLTVYYLRHASDRFSRYFYTITLLVVLAGAAGAGSRSGLIGASVAIVATMVTKPGISWPKRARVGAFALILAPIAFLIGFIANPNNLDRGFSDRGAGRLDFWNVTIELIKERPIVGHGFGQLQYEIPKRLLTTSGSERLNEKRDAVSAHNTWLDMTGDTGVIGLSLFVSVFIVAIYGLARPRWPYMGELSTTLLVMFLPVFTSSMFLPLLNNKLAWSIVGMAAALQVASNDARWSGLAGRRPIDRRAEMETPSSELMLYEERSGDLVARDSVTAVHADPLRADSMPDVALAKWDLRITRTLLRRTVLTGVVCGLLMYVFAGFLPSTHVATVGILAPKLNTSSAPQRLNLSSTHSQSVLTLPLTRTYAAHLKELSGLDTSVAEISEGMSVARLDQGGLINISFSNEDLRVVEAAKPHLLGALNAIFVDARELAADEVANQSRPIRPGEQTVYKGPPVIPAYSEATMGLRSPKQMWMAVMAALAGAVVAFGIGLSGSRRPRICAVDDLYGYTGLPIWSRLGGGSIKKLRTSPWQLEHLSVMLREAVPDDAGALRVAVAPPTAGGPYRRMALGLAGALVASGERVVFIDADLGGRFDGRVRRALRVARDRFGGARPDEETTGPRGRLRLSRVNRRTLPPEAQALIEGTDDELRRIDGQQLVDGANGLSPDPLAELDPSVSVVLLVPPMRSGTSSHELFRWCNALIVPMRTGVTTTDDAQSASARVLLHADAPSGVVLLNS